MAARAAMPRAPRLRVHLRRMLRALGPAMARSTWREALRAAMGAGLGLALCGAILVAVGGSWALLERKPVIRANFR